MIRKIKKGDRVLILSGDYKKNIGFVTKIFLKKNRAIIKGINIVKKHIKPNVKNPKGGILEKESSIHISNLKKLHVDEKDEKGENKS
ncbi:50S ribosomal protein L24 [Blattabacterium cuenoti]|uniref:50S ribosomal protein L24 n=1 Tax=Blattabacterium cuenoti TaxID=1653831 RepID=UPI00163CD2AE|nr:50S ribosomal protein L24 [Blattabacterium cuenoti]